MLIAFLSHMGFNAKKEREEGGHDKDPEEGQDVQGGPGGSVLAYII